MTRPDSKKTGDTARGGPGDGADPLEGIPCPTTPARYLPLLYPAQHGLLKVVLCNDHAFGWLCHWQEGHSRPHSLQRDECDGCRHGSIPRWYAFAFGVALPSGRHGILTLSGTCWLDCEDLRSRQGNLRGLIVTTGRQGTGPQSRQYASVEVQPPGRLLPAARDVRPLLSLYWGYTEDWLEYQCGPHPRGLSLPGEREGAS
jgi:hypothetical protein